MRRVFDPVTSRIKRFIEKTIFKSAPYDYVSIAYLQAAESSAEFFLEEMRLAANLVYKNKLLLFALGEIRIEGLWLEFGVFKGRDIRVIGNQASGMVFGFDSFEGLPEDWTYFQRKGRFSVDGELPEVPSNVELIKGWFNETLPGFLESHLGPVAFLHIDSDLYSSAKYVLRSLNERVVPGTIILFDDFLNYPGWQHGESKAFFEFLDEFDRKVEYIGFSSSQQAVAVRVVE